ncbi:MAG TPA: ACT domain-containing protein [Candidatus Angelobacter sp.]|nr:ACT domain-containing protein [Candidatus Angelobacter sp.]
MRDELAKGNPANRHLLKYSIFPGAFAVCRLPSDAPIPEWSLTGAFQHATRTPEELSVICPMEHVPDGMKADGPWMCLKLAGPFAFLQTGVLASFLDPLAQAWVPIFAVSTYDTDYVFIKEEFYGIAFEALRGAGHEIQP